MSPKTIDCRGMACPQPVLQVRAFLQQSSPRFDEFCVLVDNQAAEINVTRFLSTSGYSVSAEIKQPDCRQLTARKTESPEAFTTPMDQAEKKSPMSNENSINKTLVVITSARLGTGSAELGQKLMFNFLSTLPEMGNELWRIILLNEGVTLTTTNSPCADLLKNLEKSGVSLLVCGTCLDHYQLTNSKATGETTNMLDVVTSMQIADKIICL